MTALSKAAAEVESELGTAWTKWHVGAQALRFLSGVIVTLLWTMHSGFTDWTDLLPLVAAAGWTTAAQMWPQVPWSLLRDHLAAKTDPAPVVTAAPTPAPEASADPPPVKG